MTDQPVTDLKPEAGEPSICIEIWEDQGFYRIKNNLKADLPLEFVLTTILDDLEEGRTFRS